MDGYIPKSTIAFVALAMMCLVLALALSGTVEGVYNIGLLCDKVLLAIIGCTFLICGVVLFGVDVIKRKV